MSIASGFTKMKNYILTSSGYKLLSRWTSSQTVHMGDGTDDTDTVEYRFGAMKGVTSSLATDNDEFALSASAGKNLQDQCTQLNQSLTWKQVKTEGKYFDFSNINYKEIHIIAYYNNYRVSCSFTQDDNGNYYFGSNEPGWVGAVIIKDNTNKDISLQNFLLSGSDVTIDANIAVYYR